MKNLIKIFLLFILFSIIKCQQVPRCLYNDIYAKSSNPSLKPAENYVDWWIYEHFNKPGDKGSGSSFYTDSNLKNKNEKILELSKYNMRVKDQVSPITQTFGQANGNIFSSISYNNAFDDGKGSAHAKGFFIWNEHGGIHVIHSIPYTPQEIDDFFLHSSEDSYLQHSICITLKPNELDIIPKYLIYTNPAIKAINNHKFDKGKMLSKLLATSLTGINDVDETKLDTVTDDDLKKKKYFSEIDEIIKKNFFVGSTLSRKIKILQWAKLAGHISENFEFSSDANFKSSHYYHVNKYSFGEYFVQTSLPQKKGIIAEPSSKNFAQMNNIELLWQYIGKYYKNISKWMSQTMTSNTIKGFANNVVSGTSFSIALRLNYPFIDVNPQRSSSKDHSKLMYGTSDDGQQKTFCLGDLNWQRGQESRGGGAYCMDGIGYLVDYMERHVTWIRKDITYNIAKLGVPQSTIGTEIDFSWIMNQFAAQNLDNPMGFEILIPQTLNPLPKRVIEPKQSNYKTTNAPLLVQPDTVGYKTEDISIDVFPSVKDKVHICLQSPECPYESSAKFNIISNINLIVTPSQKDIHSEPVMIISSNPNLVITVSQVLKNNYFSSLATEKIVQLSGNINRVYLEQTQTPNNFKFEFSPSSTNTPCTITPIGTSNSISVMFDEACVDQLIFCLFSHYKMNSINNIQVFNNIDQASFYNDVTEIIKVFFPNIENGDIGRCVKPLPPPGSITGDKIDEVMESQADDDKV
ncbi:hypothetical protein DDB_G0291033 [Dictyostelium discoideum AX4]|uniref:Uncharacterized protein n=1 Tax=Dictyostelium discoideum TaxID=44689 RepID=Q54F72_DICDI|nr:hypothetical protein DDB_G0291033 [Dictyostelium discoideum AX4]EAL61947.1 hypothetical protein DDB_G0291033 [Dictyostelium discoideum AX4]|eukprot:XP_635465.1 hypothetical protein DDB_G0291033 [Dictyostelium discoideum AX4]